MQYFQVDAFATQPFTGNPAIVVPLQYWLKDELLQNIAAEHNLSETAFYVKNNEGIGLRWFTPNGEVRLCGHATLATAHVLFQHMGYSDSVIKFDTLSGPLLVEQENDNQYKMTFPADYPKIYGGIGPVLEILNIPNCIEIVQGKDDIIVVLEDEYVVKNIQPNFQKIAALDCRGIVVTSRSSDNDFISRCFYPKYNINEDPATGSAHTALFPYWSQKINKDFLTAVQWSNRKGYFKGQIADQQVIIYGRAYSILEGKYLINDLLQP